MAIPNAGGDIERILSAVLGAASPTLGMGANMLGFGGGQGGRFDQILADSLAKQTQDLYGQPDAVSRYSRSRGAGQMELPSAAGISPNMSGQYASPGPGPQRGILEPFMDWSGITKILGQLDAKRQAVAIQPPAPPQGPPMPVGQPMDNRPVSTRFPPDKNLSLYRPTPGPVSAAANSLDQVLPGDPALSDPAIDALIAEALGGTNAPGMPSGSGYIRFGGNGPNAGQVGVMLPGEGGPSEAPPISAKGDPAIEAIFDRIMQTEQDPQKAAMAAIQAAGAQGEVQGMSTEGQTQSLRGSADYATALARALDKGGDEAQNKQLLEILVQLAPLFNGGEDPPPQQPPKSWFGGMFGGNKAQAPQAPAMGGGPPDFIAAYRARWGSDPPPELIEKAAQRMR